jgi:hypothetical protein
MKPLAGRLTLDAHGLPAIHGGPLPRQVPAAEHIAGKGGEGNRLEADLNGDLERKLRSGRNLDRVGIEERAGTENLFRVHVPRGGVLDGVAFGTVDAFGRPLHRRVRGGAADRISRRCSWWFRRFLPVTRRGAERHHEKRDEQGSAHGSRGSGESVTGSCPAAETRSEMTGQGRTDLAYAGPGVTDKQGGAFPVCRPPPEPLHGSESEPAKPENAEGDVDDPNG